MVRLSLWTEPDELPGHSDETISVRHGTAKLRTTRTREREFRGNDGSGGDFRGRFRGRCGTEYSGFREFHDRTPAIGLVAADRGHEVDAVPSPAGRSRRSTGAALDLSQLAPAREYTPQSVAIAGWR